MKKWEYKQILVNTNYFPIGGIDEMGEQGWELCWIETDEKAYGDEMTAIFKREKEE